MSKKAKRTFNKCDYADCNQYPTFPKEVGGVTIRLCGEHYHLIEGDS